MGELAEQCLDDAVTYGIGFYGYSYDDVFELPALTIKEEAVVIIKAQPFYHGLDKDCNF